MLEPTDGRVEKVEIKSDSDDDSLEKIEDAEPVNAGGNIVGRRIKKEKERSGPDKEEDVRGPGRLSRTGHETLIVGGNGLSEGFEDESDSDENPDLAREA